MMTTIVQMLAESQFCRRRQRITADEWQAVLTLLAQQHPADTFVIDSCPLAVPLAVACTAMRAWRIGGYCAAKDEYFYGLKAHTAIAASGRPVEVLLLCGCSHDLVGMKEMTLNLPEDATIYADKAYTDRSHRQENGVRFRLCRQGLVDRSLS